MFFPAKTPALISVDAKTPVARFTNVVTSVFCNAAGWSS
jgi:hypothetical protein